jgi:hypothetical protein
MKERIEELARSVCKTDNISSPSSEWFLTTDGLAKQAITTAVNEALELAAVITLKRTAYEPDALAIRNLKVKE